MKFERIKNATQNLGWGLVNKILLILLSFIIRTVKIYYLGVEFLGLSSLFASVLNLLNLAELGFGSALIYSMYKPVAEKDTETICALLNFYKKAYRIIGSIVLVLGLTVMPFLDFFISGNPPDHINIEVVYLLILCGTVVTYFMFAYMHALLSAHQKTRILSIIHGVLEIPKSLLQIFVIVYFKNYYLLLIIIPVFTVLYNIIIALYVKKEYPDFVATGKLEINIYKDIIQKIKGLVLYKLGHIIGGSIENIFISAFLGLSILAIYSNYYYVLIVLHGFTTIYYNSIRASIGNSIVTESKEKNFNDFKRLFFIQGWFAGWMGICLICLFQHFIILWLGSAFLLEDFVVACFVLYFYIWKMLDVVHVIKEAAGMWYLDKWRPLATAFICIILYLLLIRTFGILGVILPIIFCHLFVELPWSCRVLFRTYYRRSTKIYYKLFLSYTGFSIFLGVITYCICRLLPDTDILSFVGKILICLFLPNTAYYFMYRKRDEFLQVKILLLKTFRK